MNVSILFAAACLLSGLEFYSSYAEVLDGRRKIGSRKTTRRPWEKASVSTGGIEVMGDSKSTFIMEELRRPGNCDVFG